MIAMMMMMMQRSSSSPMFLLVFCIQATLMFNVMTTPWSSSSSCLVQATSTATTTTTSTTTRPPILYGTDTDDTDNDSTTVANRFKAPNAQTPANLVQKWHEEDEALWNYVQEHVPDVLEHTGTAAFDEHLKGVQAVLRYWDAPDHLTKAGLFHSIYGTEGFQGFALPLTERNAIRSLIGERAEKLAFIFCMVDRSTLDETVYRWNESDVANHDHDAVFTLRARPEMGRFPIHLNKEEWLDFVELTLGDWLEQVEGAAAKPNPVYMWKTGQAYCYRRTAYEKMSRILVAERGLQVAAEMYRAVMATEAPETRHLIQARTPPMNKAAADALAALRAIGEDIPVDLSPQSLLAMPRECQT